VSPAAIKFHAAIEQIRLIRDVTRDPRLRPVNRAQTQAILHATLAGYVATWEAYLEQLTRDFYSAISSPARPDFHALHTIALARAIRAVQTFNTPNPDNARNLLLENTGFDPWPVWIWPARRMNVVQVRELLTQILDVRHSFAHGYSMRAYPWTTSVTGRVRLNWAAVSMTEALFRTLITRTDSGMKQHVETVYALRLPW